MCKFLPARSCLVARLMPILVTIAMSALAQTPQSTVTIPRRLTLAEAESLLLQRNLAIAVNRQQLEVAEATKLIASYKPNPTIQLGAEQYPIHSPLAGSYPRFFTTDSDAGAQPTYTFLFTKLIERGGKRELRTKQAEAQVAAARAQILEAFRQQRFQLRQAFGGAVLARQNLALAEQALTEYEQTETLTDTRVKNGEAAQLELYRIRSGKLPYQQAVVHANVAYAQACFDVLNLLNSRRNEVTLEPSPASTPSGAPLEIEGAFSGTPLLLGLDELQRIAAEERPDIEIARRVLQAGQFGTKLADAERKRDLTLGMEYQRVGSDSSLGMVASFPLFLYNNQKAAITAARAAERSSALQLRQAELQAATDVEKAWQLYQSAQRSLKVFSEENLKQVESLRSVAFFSYRQGATSLFELLDAQRTLNQARVDWNQARFDYQNSIWLLEAAVGRDLEGAKP
ncbi:TolC family protein [Bryobacter aggregatus]|uniref:TolC family protein n=1 Tax=Bryobacter aggregatus TaxID=360054 RepID=UPI0004E1785E|nr:TolC family protein [Bryobacter aggregatus]